MTHVVATGNRKMLPLSTNYDIISGEQKKREEELIVHAATCLLENIVDCFGVHEARAPFF